MVASGDPPRGERGVALIFVLLGLAVLTLTVAAFMMALHVETKVAGHQLRGYQSLDIAEAGISEALSRIRMGDIPNNNNPKMVSQIFLANPGMVPVLGQDSIALATAQASGSWLQYSLPTRDDRVLTVKYKTDAQRTQIYRYDATKSPPIQTQSGLPIFVVTSTGRKGADRCKLVTEVVQLPVNFDAKGALAANQAIQFSGNSDVCGYNHRADTPTGTKGRPPCNTWEIGSGDFPGAWSTSSISNGGSSSQNGSPVAIDPNQAGFYAGPWSPLQMTQSQFFAWIGAPVQSVPADPRGIFYLDNNNQSQDQSGSFSFNGGDGEGLLYIDGDVTLNGGFTYRGLLYIEGDLKINGTTWILGGVIVKGKTTIKIANGNCTILYSRDAIIQNIAKYGGQMITLSWRENP